MIMILLAAMVHENDAPAPASFSCQLCGDPQLKAHRGLSSADEIRWVLKLTDKRVLVERAYQGSAPCNSLRMRMRAAP